MKDKISQQHLVGAVLIMVLMIGISVSTGFEVSQDTVEAGAIEYGTTGYETQATISQFTYYKQITLNSSQINSTLTNFPILINVTDTDLRDHVENDSGYDIAFFTDSNVQLNHEIEKYDSATGQLIAWVNVTSLIHDSDTEIKIYYGDVDIAATCENIVDTWDSNYTVIQHMNDNSTSTILDSTSYDNDGTKAGANAPIQTTGKVGYCQLFDGDVDHINITEDISLEPVNSFTCEVWLKTQSIDASKQVFSRGSYVGNTNGYITNYYSWNVIRILVCISADILQQTMSTTVCVNNTWYYFSGTYDNVKLSVYLNGSFENSTDVTGDIDYTGDGGDMHIGSMTGSTSPYIGSIDEVRFSNIARSPDWIDITYNTVYNGTDGGFFVFGSEQTQDDASVYSIKGLPNDIVTWAGTAGTTVWCNETGDTNEWLEFNMSINATQNVTEIRVFMDDLNNTELTEYINASNITMYVANSTNTTYYSFGTFADGGSNISINQTTWNTYIGIDNPFNDTGLTDTNTSIFLVFKLTIPATSSTDIFKSFATDSCEINTGHFT